MDNVISNLINGVIFAIGYRHLKGDFGGSEIRLFLDPHVELIFIHI